MKRNINQQTALEKSMSFCSKMERCRFDVNTKLYKWGVNAQQAEQIIKELIDLNFINDTRYLESYIKGKFYLNKWGKVKIRYNLKLKGFGEEIIESAIEEYISEEEYVDLIDDQIDRKNKSLHIEDDYQRKAKLIRFAQGRGYETELALACVDKLFEN